MSQKIETNHQEKKELSDKVLRVLPKILVGGILTVFSIGAMTRTYQEIRNGPKKVDEYVQLKQELDTAKTITYIVQQNDSWKSIADKFYNIDSSKYPITRNEPYFLTGRYAVTSLKGKSWTSYLFNGYYPKPGDTLQVPANKK